MGLAALGRLGEVTRHLVRRRPGPTPTACRRRQPDCLHQLDHKLAPGRATNGDKQEPWPPRRVCRERARPADWLRNRHG
eukprot:11227982-Lingulodinium_polyedra.AAC.1